MFESISDFTRRRTQKVMFGLMMLFTKGNQIFVQLVPRFTSCVVAMMNVQISSMFTFRLARPTITLHYGFSLFAPTRVLKMF